MTANKQLLPVVGRAIGADTLLGLLEAKLERHFVFKSRGVYCKHSGCQQTYIYNPASQTPSMPRLLKHISEHEKEVGN